MKILVVGSGGREHALIWKLRQSPKVTDIFCAPGNGGIAEYASCVDIAPDNIGGLLIFALDEKIDLTIVGPEAPLANGIVDAFQDKGLKIFGPSKNAAQLEGSKVFAKEFMKRHNIATSDFQSFENIQDAKDYLRKRDFPVVVKADGLAAGKGVLVCSTEKEAFDALEQIMEKRVFQQAGNRVIIEDYLTGEEASILAISDGRTFMMLDSSQDHKRIFDNDLGPNTGGMGAYSPAPVITQELSKDIACNIIAPVIDGMRSEGMPFKGVLYAGLMITASGPKVLEFNVRFGDPETQAIIPRLKGDLVDIFLSSCNETLKDIPVAWDSRACVCVVMSARGYPGSYEKGKEIKGTEQFISHPDIFIFHAGTTKHKQNLLTSGGRVLAITALGNGIEQAIQKAYSAVDQVCFDGCFFRRDIGIKALKR